MEPGSTDADSSCELCSLQVVQTFSSTKSEAMDEATKHKLFHDPCRRCDEASPDISIRLCETCRHFRFRHIFRCFPRRRIATLKHMHKLSIRLPENFNRKRQGQCDFCRFVGSCMDDYITRKGLRGQEVEGENFRLCINPGGDCNLYQSFYPKWRKNRRLHGPQFGTEVPRGSRKYSGGYIDWDRAVDWLHRSPRVATNDHNGLQLQRILRNVRVISLSQACVVRLPVGGEYAALSYVWGSDSDGQFRSLKSNIALLEQPGSLRKIDLPATISDAMLACRKLGEQYLWVDRMCIIQDDTPDRLSEQLGQMATIYNQATLTLVATMGEDATHGLAGVGYPRDSKQNVLCLDEKLKLVDNTVSLQDCLAQSKWHQRGWTFQEYTASKRLLFFTDCGLYLKLGLGDGAQVYAEGAADTCQFSSEETPNLNMLETFTRRELTYPTDVLRASAGILEALYGNRTSFGMPCDQFENAILWMPTSLKSRPRNSTMTDVFPTWAWPSSGSPVRFPPAYDVTYSLAYWGRAVTTRKAASGPLQCSALRTSYPQNPLERSIGQEDRILAALVWLYGCIRSDVPRSLVVDCLREEYAERLEKRWSSCPKMFWDDAFQSYAKLSVFDSLNNEFLSHEGCLPVHTQKTFFTLDLRSNCNPSNEENNNLVLIRTMNRGIAGSILLEDHAIQTLRNSSENHTEFIALSSAVYDRYKLQDAVREAYITHHFHNLTVSEFYGCPCSLSAVEGSQKTHITECPKHMDFNSYNPSQNLVTMGGALPLIKFDAIPEEVRDDHARAYCSLKSRLSYYNNNGQRLNSMDSIPFIWAMLIVPSPDNGKERKLYRRLGIGKIFLKRWVESSPSFETIVLE